MLTVLNTFILQSGLVVLFQVKGGLVEINDDFTEQAEQSKEELERVGLTFLDKQHSEMFEGSKFQNSYNQTWIRK